MKAKNEISPEEFETRGEKVKKMEFPQNSDNLVVIQPNNEALGFRFNCYKEEILNGKLDKEDFDQTVNKANKICENVWRRRKMEEEAEYNVFLKYILWVAIFFSILSFIMLIILVYGNGEKQLLYISIGLIIIASTLTLFVVIKSVISKPNFIDLEETIMKELVLFLDTENKRFYNKLKMQWYVPEKFYWLELRID